MKCSCCEQEFTGSICPYCKFPVHEILGDDEETARQQIEQLAQLQREAYLNVLQLGIVVFRWRDTKGVLRQTVREPVYFAEGRQLKEKTVWFPEKLARVPGAARLPIRLAIRSGGTERETEISVPNLPQAELQQIGLKLEDKLRVRVLLKNETEQISSMPVSVAIG